MPRDPWKRAWAVDLRQQLALHSVWPAITRSPDCETVSPSRYEAAIIDGAAAGRIPHITDPISPRSAQW